ncbi:helix-turn-helix transcriptional regulator [Brevibacillus borstelensis]|uniref:helix-turn-helix transcriptional regulator n=1 Tax=Brevibacillus borstelensis TaxID=45462 RepID=UPI002E1FEA01|nr:helix-turn-helix transcriptional regulator [Brevibacillus borstelensis]
MSIKDIDDIVVHDISKFRPQEDISLDSTKKKIVEKIKLQLKLNNTSIRKLAEKTGMKHPQILRVTSGENYNIETLIRILDALNLEILIKEKDKNSNDQLMNTAAL